MSYMHIGKDYVPDDALGKVTGKAKYAEDYGFQKDGTVYARLLTSPAPHARITNIDATEALAMEGVVGILTADDIYGDEHPTNVSLPILTNHPTLVGEPILAIAAMDEKTAEDAIAKIKFDLEPLPFIVDPLHSLSPDGPNAFPEGNYFARSRTGGEFKTIKWTKEQIEAFRNGQDPEAEVSSESDYGDLDAGWANAKVIIEQPFTTAGYPHMSMEPRSAFAYWENGKCYLHGSSQSLTNLVPGMARLVGCEAKDLVLINENTGGGFGQKARSSALPSMAIPAHFSKKLGRPVNLRITREEEFTIGGARVGFQGWIKVGFRENGIMSAVDMFIVADSGGHNSSTDASSAAGSIATLYQAESMRLRYVALNTNTPHRGAQRGPGQNQIAAVIAPIVDKAARQLNIDRLAIRKINAPDSAEDDREGMRRTPFTSAYMNRALDQGAAQFNWSGKQNVSGLKSAKGNKIKGIGIGQGYHNAGRSGKDGLIVLAPDGRLKLHSGVGNLGTYSYSSTTRASAEVLKMPWQKCDVVSGRTDRHLPWAEAQDGSNSTFTHTRTSWLAAEDLLEKMKSIAAMDLGGTIDDYDIGDEQVFNKNNNASSMTYAQVAARAMELGGRYSGHEYPDDINDLTKRSVEGLAGTGLIGVVKDPNLRGMVPPGLGVSFIEIELDLETGKYDILDLVSIAECGTVLHPQGLVSQLRGGAVWGIGMASLERHLYDPQNGLPASTGYWQSKVPTNLDVPSKMATGATNIPDPQNPVGARGIGEPAMGCVTAALLCAISDAMGGHIFSRAPVTLDMIVNHIAGLSNKSEKLAQNNYGG